MGLGEGGAEVLLGLEMFGEEALEGLAEGSEGRRSEGAELSLVGELCGEEVLLQYLDFWLLSGEEGGESLSVCLCALVELRVLIAAPARLSLMPGWLGLD